MTNTIGNDLRTISSSSRPRASSRSRDEGSQAGGSPFVRKQMSYREERKREGGEGEREREGYSK